jgi:hypothetical protein
MAQSFNNRGTPALGKETIDKYGPAAGAALSVFGIVLFLIGLLFDWVKNGEHFSGYKIFTDNDAVLVRGGFLNAFLCNLPIFLCGAILVAIFIIAGAFWKGVPAPSKLAGPAALGILTLLACCPGILFFIDIQSRGIIQNYGFNLAIGYYISIFGLAVAFLGGLVSVGVVLYGGGFPKRNRM